MEFYIVNNKKDMYMVLPITPEKYEVEYKVDVETVRLTNFGDINIPTHSTPMTLQLEGLFSVNKDHVIDNRYDGFKVNHAMDYVNVIKKWIDGKDIIRVVIIKSIVTRLDASFYIESIQYIEDGETVGDIKYAITFREYRELKANNTTKVNTPVRSSTKVATQSTNSKQRVYTVVSGDYLKKISKKFYGTSDKWNVIYNANKSVIGKDPNLIHPNQKLVIP